MELNEETKVILEQYRIYSEAKERFIDRQFATNRFYLVVNLVIMITAYILATLTPQYQPVVVLSIIGAVITTMWWMNVDSYQILIKVKYAKVLEYLETKLPEQPYNLEYKEYKEVKKKGNLIVFGDLQKLLAIAIAIMYICVCIYNVVNLIRFQMLFVG